MQRGLSNGITVYAPALIVSVILGWNIHLTNILIGGLVILYTALGGTKAVSWTHVHQLLIALGGMVVALAIAIRALPHDVTMLDAFRVAGRMGRLNAIDFGSAFLAQNQDATRGTSATPGAVALVNDLMRA